MGATADIDFSLLSEDDLYDRGGHMLSVARLGKLCDPFACWSELETPISQQEVRQCIARNEQALVETPLWTSIVFGRAGITADENRIRHIQKIAWFVINPATDAISIDVGCQSMGWLPSHLVEDGNHRLAAAIIRKDKEIRVHVGGGVSDAKRMKLWNPNCFEEELARRQAPKPKSRAKRSP